MTKVQRVPRFGWVAQLAHYMKEGHFQLTHQGIAFNEDGELFDGQHRLLAVMKSGVPVQMVVTRGANSLAWTATDIGVKRSFADITGIPKLQAETIACALTFCVNTRRPSAVEITRVSALPFGNKVAQLLKHCGTQRKLFSAAPVRVAAAYYCDEYALSQYRALIEMDFDAMSAASQAFFKQATGGFRDQLSRENARHVSRISVFQKSDLFCRAMRVFNADFCQMTKVVIKDQESKFAEYKQLLAAEIGI